MKLLLVDDDIITIKGMLAGVDWVSLGIDQVLAAYDAAQAMEAIWKNSIDIILCDIEMPGKNGIELIRAVRAEYPDIACVFITCHAKFEYAQEALALGCLDYILKPAPYEVIADKVRGIVERLNAWHRDREIQKYGSLWIKDVEKNAEAIQGDKRDAKEIVEATAQYILENLSMGELSVKHLARMNYLNEDYLNRIFKREKSLSLNQFIIQERMSLAAKLLANPKLSIQAIGAQVGYANPSYFVSTFKRIFGCTPSKYRDRE